MTSPSKDRAEAYLPTAMEAVSQALGGSKSLVGFSRPIAAALAIAHTDGFAEGMKRAAEWRTDIENAPKDYTSVLLYDPSHDPGYAFEGFFDADVDMGGTGTWAVAGGPKECNPTHWMPFPAVPEGDGK